MPPYCISITTPNIVSSSIFALQPKSIIFIGYNNCWGLAIHEIPYFRICFGPVPERHSIYTEDYRCKLQLRSRLRILRLDQMWRSHRGWDCMIKSTILEYFEEPRYVVVVWYAWKVYISCLYQIRWTFLFYYVFVQLIYNRSAHFRKILLNFLTLFELIFV